MKKYALFMFTLLMVLCLCVSDSSAATHEADYVPWSGYWWPFREGALAKSKGWDNPSPLSRYDYAVQGTYYGTATAYGMAHYYDPSALAWEGMCFCWSAASILEVEPQHKGYYNGTMFGVGDKKGLLTALYDGTLYNRYYFSTPADFHGVLEDFIHAQKTPIIMNLGSDGEIWNYPVFKYDVSFTQDGNVRHYTTRIYYVSDGVPPDFVGTVVSDQTFQYYFVMEGETVIESGWEGAGSDAPPVYASEALGTNCRNPGLDYDQVMDIVSADGDAYEGNDSFASAALIGSGGYDLIAIGNDCFRIPLEQGDRLSLEITNAGGSDTILKIYDSVTPEENPLLEITGEGSTIIEADRTGDWFLKITSGSGTQEAEYSLYLQQTLAYQTFALVKNRGEWSNGMAMLRPGDPDGRVIMNLIDSEGRPAGMGFSVVSQENQIKGTFTETFGMNPDVTGYVRIDSDQPATGMETVTLDNRMFGANLVSSTNAADLLLFPHFARTGGWQTTFGMINIGSEREEIVRTAFNGSGAAIAEDIVELGPAEKVKYDTNFIGALREDAKSMTAGTISGRSCLLGYILFVSPTDRMALITLPLNQSSELVLANAPCNDRWGTGAAVMNPGDDSIDVSFASYDHNGQEIGFSRRTIGGKGNLVAMVSNLFPETPPSEIASVKCIAGNDSALCGLALIASANGCQLAGVPFSPPVATPVYLAYLPDSEQWVTGIGITNTDVIQQNVELSFYNSGGVLIDSLGDKILEPNAQWCTTLAQALGNDVPRDASYMKIELTGGFGRNGSISGIFLLSSRDGSVLAGDSFF